MSFFPWFRNLKVWVNCPRPERRRPERRRDNRVRLCLELLEDRIAPAVVTWIAGNGDWDTPSNWSTGSKPGALDQVFIPTPGITVTHSLAVADSIDSLTSQANLVFSGGALAIASTGTLDSNLTLSGGMLTGPGDVTVSGLFTWNGGTLSGSGTLTADGGTALSGGTLIGRTLNLAGTTTMNGNLVVRNGGSINNLAGGLFVFQGNVSINDGGGAGVFDNFGTFRKSTGTGISNVRMIFNNSGLVQQQAGELWWHAGGYHTGAFEGAPNSFLVWKGTNEFTDSSRITAERARFSTGTHVVDGTYQVTGGTQITDGARVCFFGDVVSVGSGLYIVDGMADFSPDFPLAPKTLTVTNLTLGANGLPSTLIGSDSFIVTGLFSWVQSTLGTTSLNVLGGLTHSGNLTLARGRLNLPGDFTLAASQNLTIGIGAFGFGQLNVADDVVINGTIDVDILNGFPDPGDSYTILTFDTLTPAPLNISGLDLGWFGILVPNHNFNDLTLDLFPDPEDVFLPPPEPTDEFENNLIIIELEKTEVTTQDPTNLSDSSTTPSPRPLISAPEKSNTLPLVPLGVNRALINGSSGSSLDSPPTSSTSVSRGSGAEQEVEPDLSASQWEIPLAIDLLADMELFSNTDHAAALLVGARPDLLPRKGAQLSPVAALVPGEGEERALSHATEEEQHLLSDFLLCPGIPRPIPVAAPNRLFSWQPDADDAWSDFALWNDAGTVLAPERMTILGDNLDFSLLGESWMEQLDTVVLAAVLAAGLSWKFQHETLDESMRQV